MGVGKRFVAPTGTIWVDDPWQTTLDSMTPTPPMAGSSMCRCSNGEDERTMHHRYAAFYHQAYTEPYPDHSGFVLGRRR